MSRSTAYFALYKDAIQRHGGLWPLLVSLLCIFLREGVSGFSTRKGEHGKRLQPYSSPGRPNLPAADPAPSEAPLPVPETGKPFHPATLTQNPGMTLIGHPYVVLGRAEDIRTAALACDQADIPFSLVNLHGDYGSDEAVKHKDFPFFDRVGAAADLRANLFFLNADEMSVAAERLGRGVFEGPYNIGCFAWELSQFPDPWLGAFERLHEIWAPTRFIQQAIAEKTDLPVIWMPFAVEPGAVADISRKAFDLPDNAFLFLFFFDFRAYAQRKNPWAVLQAFFQAFPPGARESVQLVIKVNGTGEKAEDYQAFLNSPLVRDARVHIIDQVLDDRGIKALVHRCDCFVSLHRSEGFGRGLAEAMYFGKPVIATAYSGNLDFMNPSNACLVEHQLIRLAADDYPYGEGQLWADADVEQAAWYMKKLVSDRAYADAVGQRAAAHIREFHSYAVVGRHYRRRLEKLGVIDA